MCRSTGTSERTPRVGLSEQRVGEFVAALGARTPAPASGAATALTAALAAALVELVARFADDDAVATRANVLAARLMQLADEDSDAYTAFMAARTDETRRRIVEVPEEVAASADEIGALADSVRARVSTAVAGDADAAAELAEAAARVARRLVALNKKGQT
jgi:methenyltetrahydrofolate cyclohydrolase